MNVPSSGAQITFVASSTLLPGNYTISLNGTSGTATANASIPTTVQSGAPPNFYFNNSGAIPGILGEVAIPAGSSGQIQLRTYTNNNIPAYYEVQLAAIGLPSGTTATFSPQTIIPGQSVTVTLTANTTAPITQNALVTVLGTPLAPVPTASAGFLADITGPGGALSNNRTDYVSTEGTPNSAVYDSVHDLIFSSNPSWNRVDVISNASHKVVKSIPVMAPRGIDISQDSSQVWVATASQMVYSIKTNSFAATRYLLPNYPLSGNNSPFRQWQARSIFALADGTLMLNVFPGSTVTSAEFALIWNPANNALTNIAPPSGSQYAAMWEFMMRTGDGKRVYSIGWDSAGESFWYDVLNKTVSPATKLAGYVVTAAVNFDGSRVAVDDVSGLNMYDGNLNLVGPLPGGGIGPGLNGGLLFSADNTTLYEECTPVDIPVIYTIDAGTRFSRGVAPAMPFIPASILQMSPSFYVPVPFAADKTGMLLSIEDWGIAFEDSTYFRNFATNQTGTPTFMQHMSPYAGQLNGGTASSGFGNAFSMTPDVWYGANAGTASLGGGALTITSPPASASGPVNVKFLFPDGIEVFDPQFFTYGSDPKYAVLSGASPDGNVPGRVVGLGLPSDPSGGSLLIGGNTATITTQKSQYLPYSGDPFPSTFLDFTVPSGAPGWADLEVDTPNGKGILPKSLFYAKSVKDYSTSDSPTAILYDAKRQQVYLSAQDHIDVFSLSSNQFVAPIFPPARGSQKQFTGLALAPDESLLLAADLLDGSLAVINPDNPASSSVLPIAAPSTDGSGCKIGPLYVAAAINQTVYVVTGALPSGTTCGPGGIVYVVDLATSSVSVPPGLCGGGNVAASHDGSIVAFGENPRGYGDFCTYNVSQNVYSLSNDYRVSASIAGDGNVAAAEPVLFDANANVIGAVAQPEVYYPTLASAALPQSSYLLQPQLNDSGSLLYATTPNFVDIIDVQHGLLRMRFSLNETVANVASPIAIDSGGQHIYLITNQGLTVVDLGTAPLSIGHLSPGVASPGAQITLRGSGFASGIMATVGGQAASVNLIDENTLTLTIPAVQPGPQDIVLTNVGGISYTLENGVTVQ